MMSWEYAVVNAWMGQDYMAEIRVMGWQGWELVSAVSFNGEHGIRFFFKRPKPTDSPSNPTETK